jgi:hypothetical protein
VVQSGPVRTSTLDSDRSAYLVVGEEEDSVERYLVVVEDPWEQPFDPDGLAFTKPPEFCNRTGIRSGRCRGQGNFRVG